MSVKRRIPLVAFQKALYDKLTAHQTTPVYDEVPDGAVAPYITMGEFTYKPVGAKDVDSGDATLQLHIWSDYNGKTEVNGIADDLVQVISAVTLDMSASGFKSISLDIDFFEAFPEDPEGYHGVLTIVGKTQNVGE